jgi:hypothetical protein
MSTYYKSGQWNAICDRCGFKFKSGELKKDWQGLMVCSQDYEQRNPQDFLRVYPEKIAPDWARPEGADQFLEGDWLETEDSSIFNGELSFLLTESGEAITTET